MLTKRADIQIPLAAQRIPRDFSGPVFVSDIDKTYLATQIDSLGGLLRAAFEAPESKHNVPGFSIVLRAVRRGGEDSAQKNPLFFLSASPPQMRPKLLAKMEMDGVEHDGIICKNQLSHVRKGSFKKLTEQIGYKLLALLLLWKDLPRSCFLVVFGDDSESDAVIYSLFEDILNERVRGMRLTRLLQRMGVFREDALLIAWLARCFRGGKSPLRAAYINLETGSQASYYQRFGNILSPTNNSLQMALSLYEKRLVRDRAVRSIGRELILHYDFSPGTLWTSLLEAVGRGLISRNTVQALYPLLVESEVLPANVSEELEKIEPPFRAVEQNHKMSWPELMKKYSDEGRY